jgi:molybdenum cofactor biosynthesis enzyme MoaA
VELLGRVPIGSLVVSLNAATATTYRYITGSDGFGRVLENVRRMKEFSGTHKIRSFEIYLSFVVMKSNLWELPDFLRLAESLAVKVQLLPVIGDRGGENVWLRRKYREVAGRVLAQSLSAVSGEAAEQIRMLQRAVQSDAGWPAGSPQRVKLENPPSPPG